MKLACGIESIKGSLRFVWGKVEDVKWALCLYVTIANHIVLRFQWCIAVEITEMSTIDFSIDWVFQVIYSSLVSSEHFNRVNDNRPSHYCPHDDLFG